MDKKYLKGSLNKNIAFGLAWLAWPFAIVLLILDKDTLTREEKVNIVSIFVCAVACYIPVVCIVAAVFVIIAMIKAFMGKEYNVPLASKLAEKFVK